jgi:hypothetical protein
MPDPFEFELVEDGVSMLNFTRYEQGGPVVVTVCDGGEATMAVFADDQIRQLCRFLERHFPASEAPGDEGLTHEEPVVRDQHGLHDVHHTGPMFSFLEVVEQADAHVRAGWAGRG